MASYLPPSENLPIFDSSVFDETNSEYLTYTSAKKLFLTYPTAQGEETIASLIAGTIDYTTPLSGSFFEIGTNQVSGGTILIGPTGTSGVSVRAGNINCTDNTINNATSATLNNLSLANSQTSGILNIGTGTRVTTGSGGAINIGTGASVTAPINIGGGASSSGSINIGHQGTTTGTTTTNINISTVGSHPVNIGSSTSLTTINGTSTLSGAVTSNTGITCSSGGLTLNTGNNIIAGNLTGGYGLLNTMTGGTLGIGGSSAVTIGGTLTTSGLLTASGLIKTTQLSSDGNLSLLCNNTSTMNIGTSSYSNINIGASGGVGLQSVNIYNCKVSLPEVSYTPSISQLGYTNSVSNSSLVSVSANTLTDLLTTGTILPLGVLLVTFNITVTFSPASETSSMAISFNLSSGTVIVGVPANTIMTLTGAPAKSTFTYTIPVTTTATTNNAEIQLRGTTPVGTTASIAIGSARISWIKIA